MNLNQVQVKDSLLKRILILYGTYSILSNVFFLAGYYLLPEGFLRGSPDNGPYHDDRGARGDEHNRRGRVRVRCE